jgi:hypothetical protein
VTSQHISFFILLCHIMGPFRPVVSQHRTYHPMTSHHWVFLSSDITTHCHFHSVMSHYGTFSSNDITSWGIFIQWHHNTFPFSFTNVTWWDLSIQWRHNMGRWPLVLETPHKFQRMRRRLLLGPVLLNFLQRNLISKCVCHFLTTFTLVYRAYTVGE